MRFYQIFKILLNKSQILGGPGPPRPPLVRGPWLFATIIFEKKKKDYGWSPVAKWTCEVIKKIFPTKFILVFEEVIWDFQKTIFRKLCYSPKAQTSRKHKLENDGLLNFLFSHKRMLKNLNSTSSLNLQLKKKLELLINKLPWQFEKKFFLKNWKI